MAKKEKKEPEKASQEWLTTYGDMITLMLCFFVMMFDPSEIDPAQLSALAAALQGDPNVGGISLTSGRLADLGNTINSMPSMDKGRMLGPSLKKAVSLFVPNNKTNRITVTSDERGIVITLAADSFFAPGSAELDLNETRETLINLSQFLSGGDLRGRRFRIEGHTDNSPVSGEIFPSNWELSAARAINVLHYLSEYGVDEKRFSVAGYADTRPKFPNNSAEERAYNRRVDIIILDEAHF